MVRAAPGAAAAERRATIQALVGLGIAAYLGVALSDGRTSATAAAVTYVALLIGSVVLHEAGHALVVRAIGGTIREIRLGFGPPLVHARVGGALLDVRPLVIAGHVGWEPPPGVRRNQLVAVTAAGLAVHALLIVVALLGGTGAWSAWRIDLLIANVGALVSNLIPTNGALTTTAVGPNDGAQLAGLLRKAGAAAPADPRVHVRLLAAQAWTELQDGRPAAAEASGRGALDALERLTSLRAMAGAGADPGWATAHASILSTIGWALLNQGRGREAEQLLGEAMTLDRQEPITAGFAAALTRTRR